MHAAQTCCFDSAVSLQKGIVCKASVAELVVKVFCPLVVRKITKCSFKKYLSDSFHWPLAVHLKDATLRCAGHPQLMPRVQTDLLFTPASQTSTYNKGHLVRK